MTSLKSIVQDFYIPELLYNLERIDNERAALSVDGELALDGRDKCISGCISRACAMLALDNGVPVAGLDALVPRFRAVMDFAATLPSITWGRYFYMVGLFRMLDAGILDRLQGPESLEALRVSLDWRDFAREDDLSLIRLPTNYYSIAYIIAKYRELFGWEREVYSDRFLAKLLEHVEKYSFGSDYIDETDGYGRFDEYSFYILGEIASMFLETHDPVPAPILRMLRKSAEIYLALANDEGRGFSYGRTLGIHGDSTVLTTLPIAARLGLLTPDEMEIAYGYTVRVAQRIPSFWIDPQTRAVDMWEHGRMVDYYRPKNRIYETTIDNYLKVLYALECWQSVGYGDRPVAEDFGPRLAAIPATQYFSLIRTPDHARGLLVRRDKGHVFSIPFVNPGERYFANTSYLSIPFETDLLECASDVRHPNLVPRLTLADGTRLMPIAWIDAIEVEDGAQPYTLRYTQHALARIEQDNIPREDDRVRCSVRYTVGDGFIEREDTFACDPSAKVASVEMEFGTFAQAVTVAGDGVRLQGGDLLALDVHGVTLQGIASVLDDAAYHTPYGPLSHRVRWSADEMPGSFSVRWTLTYR